MRRAGRIIFNVGALVSLVILVFLAWLRGVDHDPVYYGRFAAWLDAPAVLVVGMLSDSATSWHWPAWRFRIGVGRFGDPTGGSVLFLELPHWLALSLASILPALWLVLKVTRRRRSAGRGFAVEPTPPDARTATGTTPLDP